MFLFQEAESGSDWDSLPGDVLEPSSSPEPTQPAPPAGSPKAQVSHKKPQVRTQAALATPENTSLANSPQSQAKTKLGMPSSHMPSQMYGKPGITNFVDRSGGISATAFTDRGLESRQNKEVKPDINENRVKQSSQLQGKGDNGINIEMNEVDYHQRNPPFTDFQGGSISRSEGIS